MLGGATSTHATTVGAAGVGAGVATEGASGDDDSVVLAKIVGLEVVIGVWLGVTVSAGEDGGGMADCCVGELGVGGRANGACGLAVRAGVMVGVGSGGGTRG